MPASEWLVGFGGLLDLTLLIETALTGASLTTAPPGSTVVPVSGGNTERLAFIFDKRRVQPSGLAGEIVLPPTPDGNPMKQFDRTPYIVGFKSMHEQFSLLTAHIKYGKVPTDRIGEVRALAQYVAAELRARVKTLADEKNLIVPGTLTRSGTTCSSRHLFHGAGRLVAANLRTTMTPRNTTTRSPGS
jgi:hypothetical protein